MGELRVKIHNSYHGETVCHKETTHVRQHGKYNVKVHANNKKLKGVATCSKKPDAEVILKADTHGRKKIKAHHISKHSKTFKLLKDALIDSARRIY